jgi:hypothetical protein
MSLPTTALWLLGQLGKHHTSKEPQAQPTPYEVSRRQQEGEGSIPLPGKEEARKTGPAHLVSFPLSSPQKVPLSSLQLKKTTKGWEDVPVPKWHTAS